MATSGMLKGSKGLAPLTVFAVEEDDEGVTLWSLELPSARIAGEVLANAYGRFSGQSAQDPGWFTRDMLRHRIAATDDIGGLGPLRDSGLIDDSVLQTCLGLWSVRVPMLDELELLPHVLCHGDALPRNMLCQDGHDVIAVDWGQLGYNTVGADLATLSLYSDEDLAGLIPPYIEGLREGGLPVDEATVRGATVQIAALIAISRASRAIAAGGDVDAYVRRLVHAEPVLNEAVMRGRGPRTR